MHNVLGTCTSLLAVAEILAFLCKLDIMNCIYCKFKCQPKFWLLTGQSNDPKKTNKFLESRIMELEEQVQQLDKVPSEKDTLIEKCKIVYKQGEYL